MFAVAECHLHLQASLHVREDRGPRTVDSSFGLKTIKVGNTLTHFGAVGCAGFLLVSPSTWSFVPVSAFVSFFLCVLVLLPLSLHHLLSRSPG